MSVGGKVVETIVLGDRVWIATREPEYPLDEPTAIYVERTAEARTISEGDSVWWHGVNAYWTPRNRAFEDRPLRRIGYSGRFRPDPSEEGAGDD